MEKPDKIISGPRGGSLVLTWGAGEVYVDGLIYGFAPHPLFHPFLQARLWVPKMVDSIPSTADEKVLVIDESKPRGFFSRRAAAKSPDAHDEKNDDEKSHTQHGDVFTEEKPAERELTPVSFTELFRCVVVFQKEIHS